MLQRLLYACLALLLLAGCSTPSSPPASPEPDPVAYPQEQVVLQVAHGGGFRMPDRVSNEIPDVTIWGDGRVVFAAADGTVREGMLERSVLDRLVASATFLYGLEEQYSAAQHTDDATATFTVMTDQGRKTVSVYALHPMAPPPEGEPHPAEFAKLRTLWAAVQAALPADAPEMKPTDVYVMTFYSDQPAIAEWPAELQERLRGAQATRAVELAGLGEAKTFLVDGKPQRVLVVPEIPWPWHWEK